MHPAARRLARTICGAAASSPAGDGACPHTFLSSLFAAAAAARSRLLFPEPYDGRVLAAAAQLAARGLAAPVLLGREETIRADAAAAGVDLAGCAFLDPTADAATLDAYAAELAAVRRHRGVSLADARAAVLDPNTYAALALRAGVADGVVSGAATPTADVVRPALTLLRRPAPADAPPDAAATLASAPPPRSLVSSVFFMCFPSGVTAFADCAVNVAPSAAELATIALDSAATAAAVAGLTPRVALLSYSTKGSGSGGEVDRVAAAAAAAAARAPDGVAVDGPLQYDAAVSPRVAAAKLGAANVGPVAGRANVLM